MLTKWFEKLLIKRLIDKIKKKNPKLANRIDGYWETNKDELSEKIEEKVEELVKSKVGF